MILYFYLQWLGKRPEIIEITKTPPKIITFQCQFKSHTDLTIIVCGNLSEGNIYQPSKKQTYSKPQYLMSHLQKAIRRMESMKSLQTAKHLLDLDTSSFLRRLPIIMLEDVYIHSSISVVIWLMIAVSKKYVLQTTHIKWLLGVVYFISVNKEPVVNYQKREGNYQWDIDMIDPKINTLLYSLRFRQNYGGMKGDMKMIEDYIYQVLHKIITIQEDKIPLLNIDVIQSLNYSDWIYQANDFHCNRYLLKQVSKKYPRFSEEYCKQLIWEHSSCINKRHKHNPTKKDDWKQIKPIVKYFQKNCIFY